MSAQWEAVRISADMWNVYQGDEFSGYIHKTGDGWRVDMQRQPRKTAAEAAGDAWGSAAAQCVSSQ
jgi:hypothetical protein